MTAFPHLSNRAWATKQRSTRSVALANRAVFFEFGWRRNFSAMLSFVAWNAKSNSIRYIQSKIGILCEWLDVMSVQDSSRIASGAGPSVADKDRSAPFCKIASAGGSANVGSLAPLPCARFRSNHGFSGARARAESLAERRASNKRSAAMRAETGNRRASPRPAFLRAITSRMSAIFFHAKRLAAQFAQFCDLAKFHFNRVAQCCALSKKYVAIQ
jgi:hypothetical protein